jgi:hypothetical protein
MLVRAGESCFASLTDFHSLMSAFPEERISPQRRPPFSHPALNDAPTPRGVNCVGTNQPPVADWNSGIVAVEGSEQRAGKWGGECLHVLMESAGTAVAWDGSWAGDCAADAIPLRECATFTGLIVSSEEPCVVRPMPTAPSVVVGGTSSPASAVKVATGFTRAPQARTHPRKRNAGRESKSTGNVPPGDFRSLVAGTEVVAN